MSFESVIKNNCEKISAVSWWPGYAYHYTDVTNAVEILKHECMFSRIEAGLLSVMVNDNASRQVIDNTLYETKAFVRFYYRPKTPTQYYNEGYKHPQIRFGEDKNANVPVPVFFAFRLEDVLRTKGIMFSEKTLAGAGSILYTSEDDFDKLAFDRIYSDGPMQNVEDKMYRQAEIVIRDRFRLEWCRPLIYCRNQVERNTLLMMLKKENRDLYNIYRDKIRVHSQDMYYNNGLYVADVNLDKSTLAIQFSDTVARRRFIERWRLKNQRETKLELLNGELEINWLRKARLVDQRRYEMEIDYENPHILVYEAIDNKDADELEAILKIEGNLMCCISKCLTTEIK